MTSTVLAPTCTSLEINVHPCTCFEKLVSYYSRQLTFDLLGWCIVGDWYWLFAVGHFDLNDDLAQRLQQKSTTGVKQTGVHLQYSMGEGSWKH